MTPNRCWHSTILLSCVGDRSVSLSLCRHLAVSRIRPDPSTSISPSSTEEIAPYRRLEDQVAAICVRAGISEHSFESSISIETRTGMTNRVYLPLISRTDEQRLDRRLCQRRPTSLTEAYPSRKNIPERNDFSERRGRSGGSSSSEVRGFREWNVTSEDPRATSADRSGSVSRFTVTRI